MALAFYQILKNGGLGNGGFNFDAKVRRQSLDPADLLHGHIGGLDILARGLKGAAAMIDGRHLRQRVVEERYAGWKRKGRQRHALRASRTLEQIAAVGRGATTSTRSPNPASRNISRTWSTGSCEDTMVELRLHHVAVIVTDLDRSVTFYQQLFGLEPIERPPFSIPGMWLGVGALQVHLTVYAAGNFRSRQVDNDDTHFAFNTRDFEGFVAHAKSMGFSKMRRATIRCT